MHSTEALPQAQQRYTGQIRPVKGIITLCRLCCVLREYNEIGGSISVETAYPPQPSTGFLPRLHAEVWLISVFQPISTAGIIPKPRPAVLEKVGEKLLRLSQSQMSKVLILCHSSFVFCPQRNEGQTTEDRRQRLEDLRLWTRSTTGSGRACRDRMIGPRQARPLPLFAVVACFVRGTSLIRICDVAGTWREITVRSPARSTP